MFCLLAAVFVLPQVALSIVVERSSISMWSETEEVYKHQNASEVIGSNETLYLYQTSSYWNQHTTRCMLSRFIKVLGEYYVRSVEYWGTHTISGELKFSKNSS
uniref:Putative secreted protein n=1 Tax=Amblyomma tuberculatum TaxID=48802 RepID=A0A6M2E5A9_9ACAR